MKKLLGPALLTICVLGIWQWVAISGLVSSLLLPSPHATFSFLIESAESGLLLSVLLVTLARLVVGVLLGLLFGLTLGILFYRIPLVKQSLGLLALGLQTMPSVCWVPLAILWFGQSEAAMYFVTVMGSMWAMALATESAIQYVPSTLLHAARVMGSRGWHLWLTVIFPAALPRLVTAAKLSWAFAWRSLMAAEIYVSLLHNMGLGQLLHFGRELNAMDQVLAVMLVIIAVGLIMDRVIFTPLERHLHISRGGV